MAAYIGVGGVARKAKKLYIGVGGVARKVTKMYASVGGVAKLVWLGEVPNVNMTVSLNGNALGTFTINNDGTWSISGSGTQAAPGRLLSTITFSAMPDDLKIFMNSVGLASFTIRFSTVSYCGLIASGGTMTDYFIRQNITWDAVFNNDGTVSISQYSSSSTQVANFNTSISITPTTGTINY